MALSYLYGYVEHEGTTAGPAERDALNGAELFDIIQTVNANISSARPITDLESDSHELRFDWNISDDLSASFGAFYSDPRVHLEVHAAFCASST